MLLRLFLDGVQVSFEPQSGRLHVIEFVPPEGSELLLTAAFGERLLFVPSESDPLIRVGWTAGQVLQAVWAGDPRFARMASPETGGAV